MRRIGRIRHVIGVGAAALVLLGTSLAAPAANAIIGGGPTAPPSWMVAVTSPVDILRPSGQFCGGVLVAPDKVVTAAHCVNLFRFTPGAVNAVFGRANLKVKDGQSVKVKKIWINPNFKETEFMDDTVEHNDTAILTLSSAVDRAPLPLIDQGAAYPAGDPAQVLGWGTTSESDLSNTLLRSTTVPLVADSTCQTAYGSSFEAATMVCAGTTTDDTCEYDSGGPLILNGRLAGLTSWAHGCAREGFPGVYTRLSAFTLPI